MAKKTDWLRGLPISHRALHNHSKGLIENTESAVQKSLDNSFAIEVDLQLSSDNEAMVFHDETLDRLTLETGLLANKTAAELKKIAFKDTSDRMQTLPELLEQVNGQVPLILEVKSQWNNLGPLEQRIVDILKTYQDEICVMSFDPRSVELFRHLDPSLLRGVVSEKFEDDKEWHMLTQWQRFSARHILSFAKTRPDFIAYHVKALPTFATQFAKMCGMPILSWTVRTREDLKNVTSFAHSPIFEGDIVEDIKAHYPL